MNTSKRRQQARQARQRNRASLLTPDDRKQYPEAAKAFVTFGGDWEKRMSEENNHRPMKRVLRAVRNGRA